MNRIDEIFIKLKKNDKKALVAYITAGDPSIDVTLKIMEMFAQNGVSIIELGVPFSDPIGDGPVNQAASERSLKSGTNLKSIFECVKKFRKHYSTPIVLFSYFNPIYQYGLKRFSKHSKDYDIDGILLVDGPFDMSSDIENMLYKNDIHTIYLSAPTTSVKRLKIIGKKTKGFLYYISSLGVTGMRHTFSSNLPIRLKHIKKYTNKPICIGFGISTPQKAKEMAKLADGIIIGSAFVKIIEKNGNNIKKLLYELKKFTSSIIKSIDKI